MSHAPAEVDALGNINPHYQEGLKIPIGDKDINGAIRNISGETWKFVMSGFSKTLVTDPDNANGLLLILTKAEVQAIPAEGADFALVNESADPDDVRWEGRITPRGWKP